MFTQKIFHVLQGRLLLFLCSLIVLPCSSPLWASPQADYKRSLKDFEDEQFKSAYRKALSSAKKSKGSAQTKAYAVAGAAALELGREKTAKKIFKKILSRDPNFDPPEGIETSKVKRLVKSIKADRSENDADENYLAYAPFGVNQYLQGKTFYALALGGAQASFLFLGYQQYQEANKADADAVNTYEQAVKSGDDVNPAFLAFLDRNEAFVRRARRDSQLYFLLAATAYGVSVYEAMSNPRRRVAWSILPEEKFASSKDSLPSLALNLSYRF
jgi:hypothetical protein